MKKILFVILLVTLLQPVIAQKSDRLPERRKVFVHSPDTVVEAFVVSTSIKTPQKDRFYFWFQNQTILCNQGGYSGLLLDGPYKVYDVDGAEMVESGFFLKGLRSGEWSRWNPDGTLKSALLYKNGLLHGKCLLYDKGRLLEKKQYRNGVLDGTVVKYNLVNGTSQKVVYKKGKEVVDKSLKGKVENKKGKDKAKVTGETKTSGREKSEMQKQKKIIFGFLSKKKKSANPEVHKTKIP